MICWSVCFYLSLKDNRDPIIVSTYKNFQLLYTPIIMRVKFYFGLQIRTRLLIFSSRCCWLYMNMCLLILTIYKFSFSMCISSQNSKSLGWHLKSLVCRMFTFIYFLLNSHMLLGFLVELFFFLYFCQKPLWNVAETLSTYKFMAHNWPSIFVKWIFVKRILSEEFQAKEVPS